MSTERVVVGNDDSVESARAIDWAAAYATRRGLGLTIVRVLPALPASPSRGTVAAEPFMASVARSVRTQQDHTVAQVAAAQPGLDVDSQVCDGNPIEVLAGLTGQAHCVVLGATGASAVRETLLGGTAVGVVQHGRGRVVVVPEHTGDPDGPVVVGLDGSDQSVVAATVAIDEAVAADRRLVAVHVWEADPALDTELLMQLYHGEPAIRENGHEMLTELTAGAPGALDVGRIVEMGRSREILADLSATASLLVLGSRGHGRLVGALLGSVSRAVVAHARCPVMIARER